MAQRKKLNYVGCINMFESFQSFCEWAVIQKGYDESNFQLDKDILGCGKVYSKDTCVFVPTEINNCVEYKPPSASNSPKGVVKSANKYYARCRNGFGERIQKGHYLSTYEAELMYFKLKSEAFKNLAAHWQKRIDVRVYNRLLELSCVWGIKNPLTKLNKDFNIDFQI